LSRGWSCPCSASPVLPSMGCRADWMGGRVAVGLINGLLITLSRSRLHRDAGHAVHGARICPAALRWQHVSEPFWQAGVGNTGFETGRGPALDVRVPIWIMIIFSWWRCVRAEEDALAGHVYGWAATPHAELAVIPVNRVDDPRVYDFGLLRGDGRPDHAPRLQSGHLPRNSTKSMRLRRWCLGGTSLSGGRGHDLREHLGAFVIGFLSDGPG